MTDIAMLAKGLNLNHAGKTIRFTTASGFHEYYEIVGVAQDHLKVLLTVRARKMDKRFMIAVLDFEQPVVLSDYSNDVGKEPPFNFDFE